MNLRKAFKPAVRHLSRVISAIANQLPEQERFQLAEQLSMAAYPKYKFSDFGRIWLDDVPFINKYIETMDRDNWHSLDRKYFLKEMASIAPKGDFVECGVYRGASAYWLCLANPAHHVHLFDSFEGLSTPSIVDGSWWVGGKFSDTSAIQVIRNLRPFDNFTLYIGWIPETFDTYNSSFPISFLHIDVDLYDPTSDSIRFWYPRLCPGAIIICDDYGFAQCPGAHRAMKEFFADKPEKIALLPTGQGMVIKQ